MSGHPSDSTRSITLSSFFCVAAVASVLVAATPKLGEAQRLCWGCAPSDYFGAHPLSTMCYEGYATGSRDCNQQGGAVYHECDAHGAFCAVYYAMDESTDEEAVRMVLAGEMLPGDGGYYFVVNSKETVVMRKCDNSVVARLSSDAAGRLASRKPWRTGASPATIAGA